ncbi:MoaD/ThiS family protein [Paucibacter sp. APW11]|uniref:MoaD/ThiS family protein n=1 Tax=Roseateles aquae TaxID=3077235 RepID=A0ABU3PD99_9BURK|nr:MoaD/ThiS family protein [Paucibacter sp. APW11]MDT9000509.1 MoaD/ThiS family protein [Paucibacter sp. APW11]
MPRIVFTPQLRRFVEAPDFEASALSLAEALQQAFAAHPRLRDYVLDEQQHLRTHVVVFIDGQRARDRLLLSDALKPDSVVHVLQALSGG